MPYTVSNPPDAVKDLPAHAIEIFVAAYNAAYDQYDGDEEKSNATAWAAVGEKYEKKDDKWVAKEATHPHGDHVCICSECGSKVTVKEGVKCNTQECPDCGGAMVAETAGENRESLRRLYADIIQEAGLRGRVQEVSDFIERCGKALDSNDGGLIDEAQKLLTWLKEQTMMKTENGNAYPMEAYAYTPDPNDPKTWLLRMRENGSVTQRQLDSISKSLSPGGKVIQEKLIPADSLPDVKRTIRAAYRGLGVADVPKWVRGSEKRLLLSSYVPLTADKGVAQVVVIRPGINEDRDCFYPADVLARDYTIFEGVKMYANHPTDAEETERPERSIRDWVATLKNVHPDPSTGEIIGEAVVHQSWMRETLAALRDQGVLSEMGISINAVGTVTEGKVDGYDVNIIERLDMARSVDFVTEAGAGGLVKLYEATSDVDIDLVGVDVLRNRRPDLVMLIESAIRTEIQEEVKQMEDLQAQLKEKDDQITTLTQERDELTAKITEAERAQQIAEAKAEVDKVLAEAELPPAAKARLADKFKEATTVEGLEEAINAEKEYIAALTESAKPKDMGDSKTTDKDKDELREALKKMNPEWTNEQVETAVRGR